MTDHEDARPGGEDKLIGDVFRDDIPDPAVEVDKAVEELLQESIVSKIRFEWRPEDAIILARIEAAAEAQFAEMFSEAITEMNLFYQSLRVPLQNEFGQVIPGQWERNDAGRYVEMWSQLDGQQVEQCIMNLMRIKLVVAPQVTKLRNKAVYAKMVSDDVKDDTFKTVVAPQGDKIAKANRVSRVDRYHAFFNYSVWSVADTFLKEIIDFMFRLKDVRMWRIQAQKV